MVEGSAYPHEPAAEFAPSATFTITDGHRDAGVCFLGDGLTAGYGDPKALGWVSRVISRTSDPDLDLTAYNLGIRGQDSGDLAARWSAECMPRWVDRPERRLVLSVGHEDLRGGLTTARSRLNLANILDEAGSKGIAAFVVGLPPTLDDGFNTRIEALAQAQADVCARRAVPYVDCYYPLVGHDQWRSELAAGDGTHPGQAGYGLLAWLVLHSGWASWMRLSS